ncbi:MAG TPA: hypothetical protein VF026_19185, partial [Ktedonobacteraceae bacterium]
VPPRWEPREEDAGDHKGPLHIPSTALAPTDHPASCLTSRLRLMRIRANLSVPSEDEGSEESSLPQARLADRNEHGTAHETDAGMVASVSDILHPLRFPCES